MTETIPVTTPQPQDDQTVSSAGGVPPVPEIQNGFASRAINEAPNHTGVILYSDTAQETVVAPRVEPPTNFFEHNTEPRRELVEELLREGQIAAIGGPFGVGKSPLLQDLSICRIRGIPWCGRRVDPGPVILLDFESSGPAYRRSISNICRRYGVAIPRVPEDLDAYLLNDDASSPATLELLKALAEERISKRLALLEKALLRNPNALVMIDPPEVLFRIDTGSKVMILTLYRELRILMSKFPHASILLSFNMRKKDRRSQASPSLLTDARDWLEDVCGTLDIMNRSDVRLGMDFHGEDVRVINGVRRSEDMHPLLVRQVGYPPDGLSGFELCSPDQISLEASLTRRQAEYWRALPGEFRFEEVAGRPVPRSSLYRILQCAKSLGSIEERDGNWRKTV